MENATGPLPSEESRPQLQPTEARASLFDAAAENQVLNLEPMLLSQRPTEAAATAPDIIPRYRIASAYIQVALVKDNFTKKDVVDYLLERGVSRQDANEGLRAHVYLGNYALRAAQAGDAASRIIMPQPTKRPKFDRQAVTLPPQRVVTPAERQAAIAAQPAIDDRHWFPGTVMVGSQVPPELLTNMQRGFIAMLEPSSLASALVPLEDTAYSGIVYPHIRHQPGQRNLRHDLNILADDTVRVCGMKDVVLDDEETLIVNILLTFGKFGLMTSALSEAGISQPWHAMKALRHKMNRNAHGVINKYLLGTVPVNVLGPAPAQVRIKDMRSPLSA